MQSIIREIQRRDMSAVLSMMREFYASDAVYTSGSEEIFLADIEGCLSDSPFIEGYVIEAEGELLGYAMLAKSYSTEFGKPCLWIEDIYIRAEHRGRGLGGAFMKYITEKYTDCIFRLEVEKENERAVALYKKCGFTVLPYMEMKK